MYTKHSIKTLVIIGFLLMATIGLLFPSVSAYPEIDDDDGIWTDDFTYDNQAEVDENLSYTNCKVDFENGIVHLNKTTEGLVYDFKRDDHNAYKYQSFFFFPNVFIFAPRLHFIFEEGFDQDFELPNIKELNEPDVDEDEQYAITTSTSINIYVVHRFKFDLDSDAETLGNVHVRWYGKGIDTDTLKLYYWKYFTDNRLLGIWEYLDRNETNDTDVELNYMIIEEDLELALTDDGEFQICVVATSSEKPFTLMTDYVNVTSLNQDSYKTDTATIQTINPITPGIEKFYWEIFTWNDYERGDATAKYRIYRNTSEEDTLIEDKYISGNSEGLTDPPINLYLVPSSYNKLKIKATLDTDDPSVSPRIFSWTVTWQKETNKWQDNFNSSHRIAVKTRIKIEENVSINPISGDWPMFGQNPQNTRTSEGKGPSDQNSAKLYWWGKVHEDNDETVTSPVISDEYLYICSRDGTLYRYDYILDNEDQQGDKLPSGKIKPYDGFHEPGSIRDIIASPSVTDEYIVAVTGETASSGIDNYIYLIDKNDSNTAISTFDYGEDICYWSPPVVSDDKIFITTWSGDPDLLQSNENNKLLVLTLDSLTKEWEFDLPFHSFSAPAVSDEFVVVGCTEKSEDNLFALDKETGDLIWSASVGTIGKSSPVIYNNTVFVVSEKSIAELERTKVTAFRLDNGTVIWEKKIGIPMSLERVLSGYPYTTMADSTPAVYDEKLYVACPGGNVVALYTRNGTEAWSQNIYLKSLLGTDILDSSPAIADGKIYIGTPNGELYSLDIANDGEKKVLRHTYPSGDGIPFVTSPIVSNGLVFVVAGEGSGTIGNHRFYCCGSYEEPTEQINGHLISIPIELPTGKRWKNFYADFNASDDGNDIVFSILDANKKHIMTINDGDLINLGERALERVIRLRANLSADNISVNPELAYWSVTFYTDNDPPDFVEDSFTPNPGGWINIPKPTCTIDVWDNISGLNLGSAYYEIGYYENNTTLKTYEEPAKYTGVNGTKFTTLTANISALDFADNITKLDSITFGIKDYANNIGSITIDIKQDNTKPTSSVTSETDGGEFNDDYVVINAIASDPSGDDAASGIASVSLYYRYSDDNTSWSDWTEFGDPATSDPFTWNFTDVKHGGYYELYSIATDEAENVEDAPDSGDVLFILDNEPPDMPDLSGQHWFKELPEISIEFSDDFLLDTIKYQPNFDTSKWITIESDINKRTYDDAWELESEFWDQMGNEKQYVLTFWINDTLGNVQLITKEDGYIIVKDEVEPDVDLEIPHLETEWSFEDTFKVTAFATDGDGSGIKSVELFYRFSEDGDFDDVNWSSYGDGGLTSEPSFEWEFTAAEGNGYYEFYVRAEDLAGNIAESEVFSTGINIFPIFSVIAMVILIIALTLITIVILIKWRKK